MIKYTFLKWASFKIEKFHFSTEPKADLRTRINLGTQSQSNLLLF